MVNEGDTLKKTVVDFITDDQHNIDSVPPFEIVFIEDFFKTFSVHAPVWL